MDNLIYYVNGEYVRADQAALPLGDLAIVRGYGVFDFLRTYGAVPFMLREHLHRLERSSQQIGLDLPWSLSEIATIVQETNARNAIEDVAIRIVVTGGLSSNFMMPQQRPTLSVMIHPIMPYPETLYTEGAAVITTSIERIMPTVKSLNYIGAIMAVRKAEKAGAIEAVYRTPDGTITEGTRSNLFVVRNGVLFTAREGILPGITRMATLEAVSGEYEVHETALSYDDLLAADEVFLTSTTKEIMPVSRVDDHVIGSGRAGECTLDIAERFRALVRRSTAAITVE
jgi:branched-chain amino acid aminotransferase